MSSLDHVRLRGGRMVGEVCPPEVSTVVYFPDHFPSSTVRILNSSDPKYPTGSLVLVKNLVPLDDFKRSVQPGTRVVLVDADVLATITSEDPVTIEPNDGLLSVTDEGPTDKRLRELGSSLRYGNAHYFRDNKTGQLYIALNNTGWIVRYKGALFTLLQEDDLLMSVEEDQPCSHTA